MASGAKSGSRVTFKFDAAGDGSGNGGIVGKTVTSINMVMEVAASLAIRRRTA